jgi:hypothetical protein
VIAASVNKAPTSMKVFAIGVAANVGSGIQTVAPDIHLVAIDTPKNVAGRLAESHWVGADHGVVVRHGHGVGVDHGESVVAGNTAVKAAGRPWRCRASERLGMRRWRDRSMHRCRNEGPGMRSGDSRHVHRRRHECLRMEPRGARHVHWRRHDWPRMDCRRRNVHCRRHDRLRMERSGEVNRHAGVG